MSRWSQIYNGINVGKVILQGHFLILNTLKYTTTITKGTSHQNLPPNFLNMVNRKPLKRLQKSIL